MEKIKIDEIILNQRKFFQEGKTLNPNFRVETLKRLKQEIIACADKIYKALKSDLGKSEAESYMCEVGMVLSELSYMIPRVNKFAKNKGVKTPLAQFAAKSFIKPSPYGVTLIISPWNYPFMLSLQPLIAAIASGNTVVLKPSGYSIHTSEIIKKIISNCLDPKHVAVITGGRDENKSLLEQKFDYIFFTGSKKVGKEVLLAAAENLTPVTLELGGKSPCIVDKSAKISLAAKRIVFGKFLNAGQTCVAPDYILCHEDIQEELRNQIIKEIKSQFSHNALANENYGKIINEKHFNRLISLLDANKIIFGGKHIKEKLKIEPTILENIDFSDDIMREEIFGPILPLLTYSNNLDIITKINSFDPPLAAYIFSQDKKFTKQMLTNLSFGGGCINDTIIHLASSVLPFGGVGSSGMGSYHGKFGFDTFSHYKGIVDKKTFMDLPMRYQPYKPFMLKIIKKFLK